MDGVPVSVPTFSHGFKKGIKADARSYKVKQSEVAVLGRLRQEDDELETILVYIIRIVEGKKGKEGNDRIPEKYIFKIDVRLVL